MTILERFILAGDRLRETRKARAAVLAARAAAADLEDWTTHRQLGHVATEMATLEAHSYALWDQARSDIAQVLGPSIEGGSHGR